MFPKIKTIRKSIMSLLLLFIIRMCKTDTMEKITYVSIEHPFVTYTNPKFLKYVNLTARRYGRASPVYYVGLNFETVHVLDNNMAVDFYFHEFLTNRYHPSFVEMHFRWCKLIHEDMFFGAAMKQGKLDAPCPYPPGLYKLVNMTILPDAIPRGFPFTKGRIYANLTYVPTKEMAVNGYVDMEIREMKVKRRIKNQKL